MGRFKQISIYFFTYFFNAALSFGVVSLLTHHLSARDYGVINLYSSFIVFLTPLLSGGILHTINVEYFKREKKAFATFLSNALVIPLFFTAFFTVLSLLLTVPLFRLIKAPSIFIWLLPVTVCAILMNEIMAILTRNQNKPVAFAFFTIGKNFLEAVLSVLLVVVAGMAGSGRLTSLVVSPVAFALLITVLLFQYQFLSRPTGYRDIRSILLISAPLIIERMSVFVISSSDRYFIDHYINTNEVGLYSVGAQIAAVANLTLLAMNNFFYPHIFKVIRDREVSGTGNVKRAVGIYTIVSLVTVAAVLVAIPIVFYLFIGSGFQSGQRYALVLTAAYAPWAFYQSLLPVLLYHQQNRYIMSIAFVAIATSLVLNFILIPIVGAIGAAITLFCVNMIMAVLCFLRVRAKYSELFTRAANTA